MCAEGVMIINVFGLAPDTPSVREVKLVHSKELKVLQGHLVGIFEVKRIFMTTL